MNWDTLQYPSRGPMASEYYQYKDTIFYANSVDGFSQSADFGKTWQHHVDKRMGNMITKAAMFILQIGEQRSVPYYNGQIVYGKKKKACCTSKCYKWIEQAQ